ncbi:DUF2486 family protein [Paraburkholderia sp.]|uniref:DUF2486 family protein n=1 Tax=Paraburkholderia sp. TaxID=1926495 RepID=UPI0025DEB906|nr:DUF2486 family protein [Paraburkholderia sp.]
MSDVHDAGDASIPLLTDTLVPGNALLARAGAQGTMAAAAASAAAPAAMAAGAPGSHTLDALDADALVERMRGRCMTWLTGEGRSVIEARCAAAVQEHSHWLVGQVSREIGLALEAQLAGWVKAAVNEELAARAGRGPSSGGV